MYLANLDPQLGTEPGKTRPVVVLQTDLLNDSGHPSTIVCSITTQVNKKATILRVHLVSGEGGINKDSEILIDQIRAIDNRRLQKEIGQVPTPQFHQLQSNLAKVLDLTSGE